MNAVILAPRGAKMNLIYLISADYLLIKTPCSVMHVGFVAPPTYILEVIRWNN